MSSCFQTDFAPCLSIAVLDTMSFQTDLSSIAIILEGGYEYLTETLRACKIYRINLPINRSGSCCAVVVLQQQKTITTHEIVYSPIARHKKKFLTFITFTFVKIFCLGYDKFPRDMQFSGSLVINPFN